MFGRRKTPFGTSPTPPTPPPPGGQEEFPVGKMDDALEASIRLFTRVLDDAGVDAGGLAIRGEVPSGVGQMLAQCTTYRGGDNGEPLFLVLGITRDFKAFAYPPHCRLYFILNSVGICEDPAAASILPTLAEGQLPGPLIDAHIMRAWVRHILPTGKAMLEGEAALDGVYQSLVDELKRVASQVPPAWAERVNLNAVLSEWASGFPGTFTRPVEESTERMNGLPVTPFIEDVLIRHLAALQADGLRQRNEGG